MNKNTLSMSFWCDFQGRILDIIQDDLGIGHRVNTMGNTLSVLIDSESLEKAFNFLLELREQKVAFDWPLGMKLGENVELFYFSGGISEDKAFIIATKTHGNLQNFYEELMKINNEQANLLRKTIKEQIMLSKEVGSGNKVETDDTQLYEELTLLNNELSNTQRELAKKNSQLEQQRRKLETLNQQLQTTVDELQRTRNELIQSEKMASLGRLVSGFAHEINTPIGIALTATSAIEGGLERINLLLRTEEVSETELMEVLDKIGQAGQLTISNLRRAAELVSSFKRTSIDQSLETKRLFDLGDVLQDSVISLAGKFKHTAIEIQINCPTGINIYSYPGAISQVFTNLLLNSWLHGFESGQHSGNIEIKVLSAKNQIDLIYQDSGKGMNAEVLKNLFEPFYTTKRAKGGTGLGLYLCYNIVVNQLKGTIGCESELDQGSSFHISFPIETISDDNSYEIDPRQEKN